jgi:hypothetical protein
MVVSFTLRPVYPQGDPSIHQIEGLVGIGADMDALEKINNPVSIFCLTLNPLPLPYIP